VGSGCISLVDLEVLGKKPLLHVSGYLNHFGGRLDGRTDHSLDRLCLLDFMPREQ
jgi:hypothetical protein